MALLVIGCWSFCYALFAGVSHDGNAFLPYVPIRFTSHGESRYRSVVAGSAFTDLRVWRGSMALATEVYRQTRSFPRDELYSLTQQMRRSAVSIPSNIAEGKGRGSKKDFRQFLFNARGSLLELQTQIMIASDLGYLPQSRAKELLNRAAEVGRSLSGLINYLSEAIG